MDYSFTRLLHLLLSCLKDMRRIALGSLREDQADCLTTFYGLSRYAAAAALGARKETLEALRVLEEGRGLALSIQLGAVDDVPEEAAGSRPGVLGDYRRAQQQLRIAVEQTAEYHERAALADEVLRLQEEIRPVGEYRWTLDEPLSVSQLCAAVSEEMAIVVIVLVDIQSYAIVARGNAIESFCLPDLKEKELTEHHMAISPLLAKGIDSQDRPILYKRINEVLVIIWETAVEPVLVHLGICPDKARSRNARTKICWIPTGVLGLYPLHAAGPASEYDGPAGSAMDFVMSSYAPTLKFLVRRRKRQDRGVWRSLDADPGRPERPTAGIIAMKKTPPDKKRGISFADLERECEVALVKRHFQTTTPDGADLCLADEQRTHHAAAIDLLEHYQPAVLHVSCHGTVDHDEPLESVLLLSDWRSHPLTVRDLTSLDVRRGRLAVLSACFTAHGGAEELQDEVSHLACSLYAAGYPAVVGSLWPAGEDRMHFLLERFYAQLKKAAAGSGLAPGPVMEAFHEAVLELRESTKSECNDYCGDPVEWAQFVMTGC